MEIKSLQNTSPETIYLAFAEAFKDYEFQLSKQELFIMLERRGFVPELSFGAFDQNQLVAFTLNGIGFYNETKTAYDTGTGTIEKYRGQGLASRIFEQSIPYLKEEGVEHYLLEVLQHNKKAVAIYEGLGFEVSREFNYFSQIVDELKLPEAPFLKRYNIRLIDDIDRSIAAGLMDFNPSWQNSFDAIYRRPENFKMMGAFKDEQLVGHIVLEPASGDITQLAVDRSHRRKGIASQLFKEIIKLNQCNSIKVVNIQVECEEITKFLASLNIDVSGRQYEMIMRLI
jgi:ribosomal protein S18 acetylase RimI-like enzyme